MSESYIALFKALPKDKWQVTFPDLPGCEARGDSFKAATEAAGMALARHLGDLDGPRPRPRTVEELLLDARGDWVLCRQFVDAVMLPVSPAEEDGLAPLELVAMGSASSTPQIGM
jgi:predicted RNase H-like HicB family nuclease